MKNSKVVYKLTLWDSHSQQCRAVQSYKYLQKDIKRYDTKFKYSIHADQPTEFKNRA